MADNSSTVVLYSQLGELLEKKLGTDLFNSVGNFIAHLTPIFLLTVTTYMMLIIWEYRTRGFDDLIIDLSKKMLSWLFLIANVIYNAPSEVAGWFLKGTAPIDNNFFEQAPISLDQLLNLINRFYDSLDWTKVGQIFRVSIAYDLINIVGHGFISITFGLYMICRVLLAVTIMIGPIFISFLFFPATRQWGINWIGQILSYLITAVCI